jgi:hypothetical protein
MTERQKQIGFLEARGNEAELRGCLAREPDIRAHNKRVADELRAEAENLRREAMQVASS